MKRTPVNPWDWSKQYQFHQAEILEGVNRQLVCSGQTSIGADGAVQYPNELRPQITAALDNLEEVLKGAGMSLSNIVRLTIYTTDVDGMIENWDAMAERLAAANVAPPQTLLGVARLAFPELMVELEVTAAD
ncbi:MAG: RidA family protein [Acidobacteriota bacterium]|nr:MAG: RidA family protein [Acidobacteriota bacterium]